MEVIPERLLFYNKSKFYNCEKPEDKNKREYAAFIYQHAEEWAEQMEQDIIKDKPDNLVKYFQENAENISMKTNSVNYYGLTGYQHDCATSILINTWKYGYELYLGLICDRVEKGYYLSAKKQKAYDEYMQSQRGNV